jgi:hypothetical protein
MKDYYCEEPSNPPDSPAYLDGYIYKRRIRATVEPFLAYASKVGKNHRAMQGHGAHVRVRGLGLGCWLADPVQEDLMMEVYKEVLAESELPGIDVLEFTYFNSKDLPASHTIEVKATMSSFAEPVGELLLVAMYAWDGNSYPGNEWWAESGDGKYLGRSDDSAAASCSLITTLQNPAVNLERLCAAAAQKCSRDGVFSSMFDL